MVVNFKVGIRLDGWLHVGPARPWVAGQAFGRLDAHGGLQPPAGEVVSQRAGLEAGLPAKANFATTGGWSARVRSQIQFTKQFN